ncbi:MAG: hypothetical protein Q7J98_11460 [Kiritimatiellia bacterium]|nr:hypothetical protein [Kiritimatiellia bacterium]
MEKGRHEDRPRSWLEVLPSYVISTETNLTGVDMVIPIGGIPGGGRSGDPDCKTGKRTPFLFPV